MKAELFMEAVGMIDEQYLDVDTDRKKITRRRWRNRLAAAVAAAALAICPLPVLTVCGVEPAYNVLYRIAPAAAQTFKPVQRSCEDQGIEMTVISAERKGSEAGIYLALHDTTERCPDGAWDLYDSYDIRVPEDMSCHCSFAEYDDETQTAYFVVHLETMDGSDMPEGKVTFSVRELLRGKKHVSGGITALDLSAVPQDPQMQRRTEISGGSACAELPDPADYRFLVPAEKPLAAPAPGISVMGIGYADGALHILTKCENVRETDNHGFIELHDMAGNCVQETQWISFSYKAENEQDSFQEMIYPVAYEDLQDCTLYGDFVISQQHLTGNWQVTFPLE